MCICTEIDSIRNHFQHILIEQSYQHYITGKSSLETRDAAEIIVTNDMRREEEIKNNRNQFVDLEFYWCKDTSVTGTLRNISSKCDSDVSDCAVQFRLLLAGAHEQGSGEILPSR